MRRFLFAAICLATILSVAECFAQNAGNSFGSRSARQLSNPTVSPYLNLLNNNGGDFADNATLNYFEQVRPQMQFRKAIQNSNQQQAAFRAAVQNEFQRAQNSQLSGTGVAGRFGNTMGYFGGGKSKMFGR